MNLKTNYQHYHNKINGIQSYEVFEIFFIIAELIVIQNLKIG